MKKYDYLVVGSGLFGAVFTHFALKKGKSVLVLEKRDHIGGTRFLGSSIPRFATCSAILARASSGVTTPHNLLNVFILNGKLYNSPL